eukprot:TRINITY_DN20627_c0_g1_i1.p1 TRINITY_DN20627_c0_g1~~TRINITY_DN20627_c0_g1_i1.p1  ORF type:complete len:606 (+),score=177.69 TRINITY_DN20627_c0_g1_i1:98-1915(+)
MADEPPAEDPGKKPKGKKAKTKDDPDKPKKKPGGKKGKKGDGGEGGAAAAAAAGPPQPEAAPTPSPQRAPAAPRGLTLREHAFFGLRAGDDVAELDRLVADYKGIKEDETEDEIDAWWRELDACTREQLAAKFRMEHRFRVDAQQDIPVLRRQVKRLEKSIPTAVQDLQKTETTLRERKLEVELKRLELDRYKLDSGETLRDIVRKYQDHAGALEKHVAMLELDWESYVADRELAQEETAAVRDRRCQELAFQRDRMLELEMANREKAAQTQKALRRQERQMRRQAKAIAAARKELGMAPDRDRRVGVSDAVHVVEPSSDGTPTSGSSYYTYGSDYSSYYYYYGSDQAGAAEGARDAAGADLPPWMSPQVLRAAFDKIDANGDGQLTRSEVIWALHNDAAVRQLLGISEVTAAEFNKLFEGLDKDGSKTVNFREFAAEIPARFRAAAEAAAERASSSSGAGGRQARRAKATRRYLEMVHQVVHQLTSPEEKGAGEHPARRGGAKAADPEGDFDFPYAPQPRGQQPWQPQQASEAKQLPAEVFGGPLRHPAVSVTPFAQRPPEFGLPRKTDRVDTLHAILDAERKSRGSSSATGLALGVTRHLPLA